MQQGRRRMLPSMLKCRHSCLYVGVGAAGQEKDATINAKMQTLMYAEVLQINSIVP